MWSGVHIIECYVKMTKGGGGCGRVESRKSACDRENCRFEIDLLLIPFVNFLSLSLIHSFVVLHRRWRFLLTLSVVNGLYIVTGFLLNFKEVSRIFYTCCEFEEPFFSERMSIYKVPFLWRSLSRSALSLSQSSTGVDTVTYDVWSFLLLISEPFLRPLAILGFYFRYLLTDMMAAY